MDSKKNIPVQVMNRVAWTGWNGYIICGNTDYTITFTFDEEWGEATAKTARFKFRTDEGMMYTDQPFTGDTVAVPMLSNIREVEVGVYVGDLNTTTGATIRCVPSILCGSGKQSEYEERRFDELMQMFNDLLHGHNNKKTLDLFYCESLETGFATDASSTELKWRGMPIAFDFAGSKVSMVQEVEKNGKLYYRLWFTHNTLSVTNVPDYIDIPISGVTDVEEEQGPDITLNGSELDFGFTDGSDNEILDTIVNNNGVIEVDGKKLFSTDDGSILRAISASYDEDGTHRIRLMFKPNGICVGIPYLQMASQTININGEKYMYWSPDLGLHKHENIDTLDKLTETEDGKLLFNGAEIGGGDTEEIWAAIDEIRGGIDDIEAMIDDSGVLE